MGVPVKIQDVGVPVVVVTFTKAKLQSKEVVTEKNIGWPTLAESVLKLDKLQQIEKINH